MGSPVNSANIVVCLPMRGKLLFGEDLIEFQKLGRREFFGADRGGVVQELDGFLDFLFVVGFAEGVGEGLG